MIGIHGLMIINGYIQEIGYNSVFVAWWLSDILFILICCKINSKCNRLILLLWFKCISLIWFDSR